MSTTAAKTVAQIEEDLENARALEREQALKNQEAARAQAARRKQREDLAKELDTRQLQIVHTEKWLNERKADAKALAERIRTEFADVKPPV